MNDQLKAAIINARAVRAFAEIQGMIAENKRRELMGQSPAYYSFDGPIFNNGLTEELLKAFIEERTGSEGEVKL